MGRNTHTLPLSSCLCPPNPFDGITISLRPRQCLEKPRYEALDAIKTAKLDCWTFLDFYQRTTLYPDSHLLMVTAAASRFLFCNLERFLRLVLCTCSPMSSFSVSELMYILQGRSTPSSERCMKKMGPHYCCNLQQP